MNKRGIFMVGIALLTVFFVLMLTTFATIEPLKESLDTSRDGTGLNTGLNCPNTPNHNAADYANDTEFERLVRRPTCFVTGNYLIFFVGTVMFFSIAWVIKNWRSPK